MGPVIVLLVAVAGGAGAALRVSVEHLVGSRLGTRLPWPLLLVNATGSFALGLVLGAGPSEGWQVVVGAGLLGGYTTFSGASLATARLVEGHDLVGALLSSAGMLLACLAAAALGLAVSPF